MRKAIILTLVLACIALFAVACQQQPQAGEAFRMPSYQDLAAQPTYYQEPVYTAQPYYPKPMPSPDGTIDQPFVTGKGATDEKGSEIWTISTGQMIPGGGFEPGQTYSISGNLLNYMTTQSAGTGITPPKPFVLFYDGTDYRVITSEDPSWNDGQITNWKRINPKPGTMAWWLRYEAWI